MWKFWKPKSTTNHKRDPKSNRSDDIEQLIEGVPTASDHPTLLFFTVHKAASSFVGRLLKRISVRHDIAAIDYMEYLNRNAGKSEKSISHQILEAVIYESHGMYESKHADAQSEVICASKEPYELYRMFPDSGFCFGPLRVPYLLSRMPQLDRFRTLIQLRDPRDCLTSMYFSKAFSHVPPPDPSRHKKFFEERAKLQEESIDDYVIQFAPRWLKFYQHYAEALQNSPQLNFVKYEQMVLDFPGWLGKVEEAWGFAIETPLRERLLKEADFDVKQEDIYAHKRQVFPGDHVRKLKPETIRQLTDLFASVLEPLGYPLEAEYSRAA